MDYEQKYKEALERAKGELRVCGSQDCDAARQIFRIFPELKDSEEEKIRKAIICGMNALKNNQKKKTFADIPLDDCIAWLEKQGEKPTTIDIDKMVLEYSQTKNSDFGLPINCMIEAYRKGINDVLHSHILDPNKVIEWLRKNTCAACWDNPDEGVSQRIEQFKKDFGL